MDLEGKVAIVTGGGRGIGKAIGVAFAREGARVVLTSRTPRDLEEAVKEIRVAKGEGIAVTADVTNKGDVQRLVNTTLERYSSPHILVNSAGTIGPIGPLHETDEQEWIQTIHSNLIGPFLCSRAALPYMIKQREGKIINLSGGGAASPFPNFTAYSASKAAIVRLTETLAKELLEYNIQVNAVAPAIVNTRMQEQILATGNAAGPKFIEKVQREIKNSDAHLEKVTRLAVFLASSKSNGLTGRLISAVWDDWENFHNKIPEILSSDLYTLRRLTPADRNQK